MHRSFPELAELLEAKYLQYNQPYFIEDDPIAIPHLFSRKEDIEIAGFLTAIIAWGNRKSIIKNAELMMQIMEHTPYDFIVNHQSSDLKNLNHFVHRTFNITDLTFFFTALKNIYIQHGGLEKVFSASADMKTSISNFKKVFFEISHEKRTEKHLADPLKKSSAKRINMYLRWMVRKDANGVDFGIWQSIETKNLMLPLDVHTGNVGRSLGLLKRKQNDWQAVDELTASLRQFDVDDPVKYDFALFGIGVNKDLNF